MKESLPSLTSWFRGIVLGGLALVLVVLLLAVIPAGPPFFITERLPHPTGNSIVEYFLTSPLHLGTVLVPAALSIWIARLDRGREDRYDRLALLAVVLAALGMATTFACVKPIFLHHGEWRPEGLVALSVVSFAASAVVSAVSLALLLFTRSPRRGRAFVLVTLVTSSFFGGGLYTFLLVPRDPPPELLDGIELPRVTEGVHISYLSRATSRVPGSHDVLRFRADAEIEWGNESIENAASPEGDAELRRLLAKIASRMLERRGRPDELLVLLADHRTPAGLPARVISHCSDEEVGIWKICVAVELDRVQEGLPNWGRIYTYLPRESPESVSEVIEIRAAGSSPPTFRYGDDEFQNASELVEVLLARDEAPVPLIRVDPHLSWGVVATTLSELLLLDPTHGDKSLNLVGMEVLER
jgi:hypothetical protein